MTERALSFSKIVDESQEDEHYDIPLPLSAFCYACFVPYVGFKSRSLWKRHAGNQLSMDIGRRNERCNEQPRTNRSAVDPLLDDKLTGRRGYHAGHASVAGKIGSPCKMSSDRQASNIYARGKHYDPNCQYTIYVSRYIAERYIRYTDAVVADKKASAGVLSPRRAREREWRSSRERTRYNAPIGAEMVLQNTICRRRFAMNARFFFSYATQTSGPKRTR